MGMQVGLILLAALTLTDALVCAGEPGAGFALESVGLRYGFGANKLSRGFQEADGTVNFKLPFRWDLGASWELKTRLDFSLGSFWNGENEAIIGGLGPVFVLGSRDYPLKIEGGISPTLVSRHTFGAHDLGMAFQFSNRIGIAWNVNEKFRVGYWFQHMSNAGMAKPNEGLNMHFLSASFCF